MEIPELVERRLGDERPRSVVHLGDEDAAVFTPDRTLVYRAEGLLSDAALEVYGHDIERLSLSPGRRKTTFVLESVAGTDELSVRNSDAEAVLEQLLGGVLVTAGVIDGDEAVRGTYLFSDLTVVVTDARLVKHIGETVWDSDYEVFPFERVTGLDFEQGQVATQVVLWVDDRAQRIKAPNDEAPLLRRTLTRAVCEFHDVESLDQLNDRLAPEEDPAPNSSIVLDEDISPLIDTPRGTDTGEAERVEHDDGLDTPGAGGMGAERGGAKPDSPGDDVDTGTAAESDSLGSGVADTDTDTDTGGRPSATSQATTGADIEILERRIAELTRAVERQNDLLERQTEYLAELDNRGNTGDSE